MLRRRVREEDYSHPQENHTRICSTVAEVTDYNTEKLNKIEGFTYNIKAKHFTKLSCNFKPSINKSGRVGDTQFMDNLSVKLGSRVMLIYNISVLDGLVNGAMGELIGVEEEKDARVDKLIVKFDCS